MAWGVDLTDEAQEWLAGLPRPERTRVARQIDKLREKGPTLGRPTVDTLSGFRHHNVKELRVPGSATRALFAFGPDRRAIVLLGGSKAGNEKRWYRDQVKTVNRMLDTHLQRFERKSACRATRAGNRSAGRSM